VIYRPDVTRIGDKLAPDQGSIVYADSDLAMIQVAKATADPAGHYRRRDVTRLLFKMAARVCLATFRPKIREPECRGRIDAFARSVITNRHLQ
jgi:hypothetical protein